MLEKVKKFLDDTLPTAKYSNGAETNCVFYRLCNVFDLRDD
jgi:hypothetical protein